ncbi:hypothetical protein [Thiohalomonas denitrificans]|uniref:Uncharacterized protein n=1 Tax=Thiohalomonas denitrificans TaxID=415747 RepID=A0A1G5Q896_9GAMM|nr:hypothetical protein [Thiohalomonas denitrificans]SCZ58105.1 hypothetical protein SAMN03097708_01605 [Thiohalomonas denitrificans]
MSEQHKESCSDVASWDASRREQLRRWQRLTLRERFEALDQLWVTAELLQRAREEGKLKEPGKPRASE